MTTKLPLATDQPRNGTEAYDPSFILNLDAQIQAISKETVRLRTQAFANTYRSVDPSESAGIAKGTAVAVSVGNSPTIVPATATNLAAGAKYAGVLSETTPAGNSGNVAIAGVLDPSIAQGIAGAGAFVRANPTTALLERVSVLGPSDIFVGLARNDGTIVLASDQSGLRQKVIDPTHPAFGARGDGVTDDSIALQAAIDAAATVGGIVQFPAGNFKSTLSLQLRSNVSLVGQGRGTILSVADTRGVRASGISHATIRDLDIDMLDPTHPRFGVGLDLGSSYITVEDVNVKNCGQYSIAVSDGYTTVIGTSSGVGGVVVLHLGGTIPPMTTGQVVSVENVGGTTEANGDWSITVIDSTHISLDHSTFASAWTSGGDVLWGGAGGHIIRNCLLDMSACLVANVDSFVPIGIEMFPRGAAFGTVAVTGAVSAGGLIKLSFGSSIFGTLATGQVVDISGVLGTTEANGTWVVTIVDSTHVTLNGSAFVNAYVSGGVVDKTFRASPGAVIDGNNIVGAPGAMIGGMKITSQQGARIVGNFCSGITSLGVDTAEGAINIAGGNRGTLAVANHIETSSLAINLGGADTRVPNNRDILVADNTIDCSQIANAVGITATDGITGAKIHGNGIKVGVGVSFAIQLGTHTADWLEAEVTNNRCNGGGISTAYNSGFKAPRLLIAGNYIESAIGDAIDFSGDDTVVIDNVIHLAEQHGIFCSGDRALIARNKFIDGNTGNHATGSCIVVGGDYYQVFDNHGENVTGSGHFKYGIYRSTHSLILNGRNRWAGMVTGDMFIDSTSVPTNSFRSIDQIYTDNVQTSALPVDTSEHDLKSVTLPQATFTEYGGVDVSASGDAGANTSNVNLRLYFGGSVIFLTGVPTGKSWSLEARVRNGAGEGAQQWWYRLTFYDNSSGVISGEVTQRGTLSVNTSASPTVVKLTAQKITAGDTFLQKMFDVAVIR